MAGRPGRISINSREPDFVRRAVESFQKAQSESHDQPREFLLRSREAQEILSSGSRMGNLVKSSGKSIWKIEEREGEEYLVRDDTLTMEEEVISEMSSGVTKESQDELSDPLREWDKVGKEVGSALEKMFEFDKDGMRKLLEMTFKMGILQAYAVLEKKSDLSEYDVDKLAQFIVDYRLGTIGLENAKTIVNGCRDGLVTDEMITEDGKLTPRGRRWGLEHHNMLQSGSTKGFPLEMLS